GRDPPEGEEQQRSLQLRLPAEGVDDAEPDRGGDADREGQGDRPGRGALRRRLGLELRLGRRALRQPGGSGVYPGALAFGRRHSGTSPLGGGSSPVRVPIQRETASRKPSPISQPTAPSLTG